MPRGESAEECQTRQALRVGPLAYLFSVSSRPKAKALPYTLGSFRITDDRSIASSSRSWLLVCARRLLLNLATSSVHLVKGIQCRIDVVKFPYPNCQRRPILLFNGSSRGDHWDHRELRRFPGTICLNKLLNGHRILLSGYPIRTTAGDQHLTT